MALAPAEIFIFRPRPFDRLVFSTRFQNHPPTPNLPVTCVRNADWCAGEGNMGAGRRVAPHGAFLLPLRIVNLPPLMLGGRWPPRVVSMSRGLLSCIFAPILQDAAAVPLVSVGIIVCNTHGNVFSCKFSCITGNGGAFFPVSLVPRQSAPVVSAVCRMGSAWSWGTCRRCRPLFGPEHRPPGDSPSLPFPPLFSSVQCLPLVVSVLLRCPSSLAVLLGSLAFVSVLLGMVVYGGIFFFIQPRPELTRAHA